MMHRYEKNSRELQPTKHKSGLIRTVVVLLIAIVLVSLIGFDIKSAVENPQTQANFAYLTDTAFTLWDKYFDDVWLAVWHVIGPPLVWLWSNLYNFNWDQFINDFNTFSVQAPSIE